MSLLLKQIFQATYVARKHCLVSPSSRDTAMYKNSLINVAWMGPLRPKARGLVQHGGLPGWLEESDPAGVILYVMDSQCRLP